MAPIFVVGAPRSGTTLLRVTLDRHPMVAMWGAESAFFRCLYARRAAFGDPADAQNRARIIRAYLPIRAVRKAGVDAAALERRLMRDGVSWRAFFATMLAFDAEAKGKPYGGEKTPAHAFQVRTLMDWFPGCSILHIVRDPRDMASSMIRMPWGSRSVLKAAQMWRSFNHAAAEVSGAANYLRVSYEALVQQPEATLRGICQHVGLPFDGSLLEAAAPEERPMDVISRAYEPITKARVAVWQSALKPWQVAAIEATAGEMLDEFGYQRREPEASRGAMAKAEAERLIETGILWASRIPCGIYRYLQPTNLAAEERWIERGGKLYWSVRPNPAPRE